MKGRGLFSAVAMVSISTSLAAFAGGASYHKFVEDNDLWKQDSFDKKGGLTQEVFDTIIDTAQELYKPDADAHFEKLTVNHKWDDSTVNADTMRFFGTVTINMYGGLARRDEVTPEGFALVLCHELGHAYGGSPYINQILMMSAEGQSDYYGAKACLSRVLPKLHEKGLASEDDYIQAKCGEVFPDDAGHGLCVRKMNAAMSLGKLLAAIKNEPVPQFETPDQTQVDETLTSYPATIQCRLDTYHNGALNYDRPRCWFKQ